MKKTGLKTLFNSTLFVLLLSLIDLGSVIHAQTFYRFSGTNASYATVTKTGTGIINNFSSPHDFTIEIRFKFHAALSGTAAVVSMHSDPADGFFMEFVSGTTTLKAGMGYNGNYITRTSTSLTLGTWYTAALVYNRTANSFNYYIDGTLVGTTAALPSAYFPETTYALAIAKSLKWNSPSPIDVDFFRIWTNQQSQSALDANKSSEVSCTSTDLLLQYKFDYPAGSSVMTDCTSNLNNGTLFSATTSVISTQTDNAQDKLAIYPNPVSSLLTIETNVTDNFQILNLLGQQVLTGKTVKRLDVSALPQGTYILKVGAEQAKFVKQ